MREVEILAQSRRGRDGGPAQRGGDYFRAQPQPVGQGQFEPQEQLGPQQHPAVVVSFAQAQGAVLVRQRQVFWVFMATFLLQRRVHRAFHTC